MKPLTAVLIDDEPLALKRLERLLKEHANIVNIIGQAHNGEEAVKVVNALKPEIIFLDIEMPVLSGFEMLQKLNYQPRIIFTTAYEAYAIKAFEENSIDYLLKPVEPERLEKAMMKLKDSVQDKSLSMERLQQVVSALKPAKELRAFPVKVGDRIVMLKPDEICYFEAREKYVFIVTENNREFITDFTLTLLEEKLPETFLRIHRAFIINTSKIKEIHKGSSGSFTVNMTDVSGTRIHTGRSYSESVKRLMEL